jgi:NADH dehydrogenase
VILLAGGSGRLGSRVGSLLLDRGIPLRVLTRDPARAAALAGRGAEVVQGDVRDPASLARAATGARTVVSAFHALTATDGGTPASVDRDGNRALVAAARAAGAERFVLVSVVGARADHPMELFRMKHAAEKAVREFEPEWAIVRAGAFMETWAEVLGAPLQRTGRPLVFGRGRNPINFVSVEDVASFVVLAATETPLPAREIDVGGPDLTLEEFAAALGARAGISDPPRHVPRAVLRAGATLARPVRPVVARQMASALAMDTTDMAFDAAPARAAWPEIPLTPLETALGSAPA